jgi:hypothetical protein
MQLYFELIHKKTNCIYSTTEEILDGSKDYLCFQEAEDPSTLQYYTFVCSVDERNKQYFETENYDNQ